MPSYNGCFYVTCCRCSIILSLFSGDELTVYTSSSPTMTMTELPAKSLAMPQPQAPYPAAMMSPPASPIMTQPASQPVVPAHAHHAQAQPLPVYPAQVQPSSHEPVLPAHAHYAPALAHPDYQVQTQPSNQPGAPPNVHCPSAQVLPAYQGPAPQKTAAPVVSQVSHQWNKWNTATYLPLGLCSVLTIEPILQKTPIINYRNVTSAVLRLECSIDCINGSVGHQQNIFRSFFHC